MTSARQKMNEIQTESYAEWAAVKYARGVNYIHCVKLTNDEDISESYTATDENGDQIVIRGQDIYNKKTWGKFLDYRSTIGLPVEQGWLTDNVGFVAIDYARWLRTGGYTKRYLSLKSTTARKWLRAHARLTSIIRFLEHKHRTHDFILAMADRQIDNVQLAKDFGSEVYKAINHANKHHEIDNVQNVIETIHLRFLALIESRLPIYEKIPELPPGTPDPLALPDDEEGEDE